MHKNVSEILILAYNMTSHASRKTSALWEVLELYVSNIMLFCFGFHCQEKKGATDDIHLLHPLHHHIPDY